MFLFLHILCFLWGFSSLMFQSFMIKKYFARDEDVSPLLSLGLFIMLDLFLCLDPHGG